MRTAVIHGPFAVVRPHEERSGTACGVEYHGIGAADAKGVDEVDRIRAGEVLPETVALFGTDQFLEDQADHVAEIDAFDAAQETPPCIGRAIGGEDDVIGPVMRIRE